MKALKPLLMDTKTNIHLPQPSLNPEGAVNKFKMSDCLEVLFVSDNGKQQSACCYDPRIGTTLMTYKGSSGSLKNCLCVIGKDYLLSAEEAKPILNVWPLNSQEPSHELKMVLPGKPSAISVSSNGAYCVAGIDGKIYVWLISSGCLLNVVTKHYQAISKILFTDDSSHFITAGEDGLILVWKLADVVAKQCGNIFKFQTNQIAPVYNFSEHSLPITDIFVGHGSLKARLFTVSIDQTCKIYCLSSGTLLLSLMFNYVLTSLAVHELEIELFIGTNSGKIYSVNLDPYPRTLEHHVSDDTDTLGAFVGHTNTVTCLSTSLDGVTLASGAEDSKVFVWNIPSKQLIKSFEMKASISNIFFYPVSNNIFSKIFVPSIIVSKFEKISNLEEKNLEMNVWVHEDLNPISFGAPYEVEENKEIDLERNTGNEDVESLKQQIVKLKEANKQLYQFAMTKILKNPFNAGLNNENNLEL